MNNAFLMGMVYELLKHTIFLPFYFRYINFGVII